MNEKVTTIVVEYHNLDGYHYFASKDVIGLHIGSADIKAAFNDLPQVIETLMESNYGVVCKAVPLMTFNEFLEAATDGVSSKEDSNRSFELRMAA